MQDTDFREGDLVGGKWRVNRLVGVGGMGAVYHASHSTMDLPAALKVVLTKSATRADLDERIRLEAKALAVLKNPHVVRILDAGLHERDCFYVAMDFLEGQPLRKVMHNIGQLPLEAALLIAHGIAMGLSAIHEKKIVHRDLKPENVMMEKGEPIIIDLGLAKVRAFAVRTTSKPFSFGTPQYMSPEQLLGENAKIDAASDVYALGVMLYEMLAGRHPQADATGHLPDGKMAGLRRIYGDVKPLSDLRAGLPSGLEPLVFELMRWEPSERPSAVETARRLRHLLRELGAVAREPSSGDVLPDRSRAQYAMRETKSEQRFPHLDTEPTKGPLAAGGVQVVVRGASREGPVGSGAPAPRAEAPVAVTTPMTAGPRPTPRQGTAAMPVHGGAISPHPALVQSTPPAAQPATPPAAQPIAQPVAQPVAQRPLATAALPAHPVAPQSGQPPAPSSVHARPVAAQAAAAPSRAAVVARGEPHTGPPVSRRAEARDTRGTAAIVVLLATFSVMFFAWGYFDRRAKGRAEAEASAAASAGTTSASAASPAAAGSPSEQAASAAPASAAPTSAASSSLHAAPEPSALPAPASTPSASTTGSTTPTATAPTATALTATAPTAAAPTSAAPTATVPTAAAAVATASTKPAAKPAPKPAPSASDDDDLIYRTKGKTP